jgi:hypothetical protein
MKRKFKSFLIIYLIICGAKVLSSCIDLDFSGILGGQPGNYPTLYTYFATNITSNTATLNGRVFAKNTTQKVSFIYYIGNYEGTQVPAEYNPIQVDANPNQVSGNTETPVSADIKGLLSDTTYHFILIGVSPSGRITGGNQSFRTF